MIPCSWVRISRLNPLTPAYRYPWSSSTSTPEEAFFEDWKSIDQNYISRRSQAWMISLSFFLHQTIPPPQHRFFGANSNRSGRFFERLPPKGKEFPPSNISFLSQIPFFSRLNTRINRDGVQGESGRQQEKPKTVSGLEFANFAFTP